MRISDENLNDEINNKFNLIENEIDIRIESIITDLHKYRDELRDELNGIKSDFIKSNYRVKIQEIKEELNELKRFNLKIKLIKIF